MSDYNITTYNLNEENQDFEDCGGVTDHQRFVIFYISKSSSFLSIIASTFLIVAIIRSTEKRRRIYQRLILSLSINHLIIAVAFFVGSWAIPKGSKCTDHNIGNEHTCNAQGMLIQFGFFGSAVYNVSLALYTFLAVSNDFKEEKFRWIEKWIHLLAFVVSPLVCIVFVIGNSYTPHYAVCVKGYPKDSFFSHSTLEILNKTLNVIPRMAMMVFSIVVMVAVFVVERCKRRSRLGLSGKQKFREDARRLKSQCLEQQSWLYLLIFYVCNSVGFAFREKPIGFRAGICLLMAVPIQGLYIAIVYYIFTRRFQKISENPTNSWHNTPQLNRTNSSQSARTNSARSVRSARTDSARTVSARTEATDSATESTDMNKELPSTSEQFVIFDGSNPSSKWAKYIFDDESEVDVRLSDEESNDYH